MASSSGTSGTSLEQRRWLVVGIGLHRVLTPCLRDKIKSEMAAFYQHVVRNFGLDKQTFAAHQKIIPPSTIKLNYNSINNNATSHRHPRHYDYCVKDEVSLAKLFMKPFMANFHAFDHSFDSSAALAVLCGAYPFTSVKRLAEDVRSQVRNEWAHCDFATWTEAHYDTCFDLMEALVTNLKFGPADETRILNELKLWRKEGPDICLGKPLDDALLQVIRNEVQQLSDSVGKGKDIEEKHVESICSFLALFKSEFEKAIHVYEQQQSSLQAACEDLKTGQDIIKEEMSATHREQKERLRTSEVHWELRQEQIENRCKALEIKRAAMERELDILRAKMDSLALSDDSREVVFDAPEQNKWFTGREKEVSILEKCLSFESDGTLKIAAISGLGGCGKTTLAAHFAWKHKPEYEGGVYWISMEDDRKFENSMNDLALRLGMLADSFDLTLAKVLTCISRKKRRWLLVLDDVDQLNLSEQMHNVLSGRWKWQASGHVLLTTRREPKEVCESVSLEPSSCIGLFAFTEEEAKHFLVNRSDLVDSMGQVMGLEELVRELGCLPLALEQAGAHIKAIQCSTGTYLKEYRIQRLKLLSQHPRAKPTWEYESENRLAVHTTWLLNFEYVRRSSHGELASRFVQAAAFLAPSEIQEELINSQLFPADDPSREQAGNLELLKHQIVDVLTKFSLFQRKTFKSLGLHRLVQEVIRSRMSIEETTSALVTAVDIVHKCFLDCPSPDQILSGLTSSVREQASESVANASLFYLWSKLTSHASELQQHLKTHLGQQDIERNVKVEVLTREASRVVYENALQLSVRGHQGEAKEAEQFAFRILDSCVDDDVIVTLDELIKLFPHTLPLPPLLQKIILYSSRPPTESKNFASDDQQCDFIDKIRVRGNALFKDGNFKEAVEKYTEAIETSKEIECLDPRLLHNRATAFLKLKNFEKCLEDSEEYIKIRPKCWKGYTRKALALSGLGRKGSALCFAAIAYSHDTRSCRRYEAFQSTFKDLDGKWEIVDSSETLTCCILGNKLPNSKRKVLLLTNDQYQIEDARHLKVGEETYVLKNSDGSNDIVDTTLAAYSNGKEITIRCDVIRFSKQCFVQNISFVEKGTIFVGPDGDVEFTNCRFKSTGKSAIVVNGTAKFIQCTISDSLGGGITVEGFKSSASLMQCRINGNGEKPRESSGINITAGANVRINNCLIYGNTEGVHTFGLPWAMGAVAKRATIEDSEIYDNKYEGILVSGNPESSAAVDIRRNKIFHNGGHGVQVTFHINKLRLQKNSVFENFWWGVWVQCNSGGYYEGNEICNNKMGGMRVGKQSPGKPACVVDNNVIRDNCGPAFHEGLHPFEGFSFPKDLHVYFRRHHNSKFAGIMMGKRSEFEFSFPNAVSTEFKPNNKCFQNSQPKAKLQAASSETNCAFCFRREVKLKCCPRCKTARYCGKECQTLHWGRHKYLCAAMGQRNAIEVSIPFGPMCEDFVVAFYTTHPSLEPTGPRYPPPSAKDGTRFIVKIQTFEYYDKAPVDRDENVFREFNNPEKAVMTIYDRSRHVNFDTTKQPRLYHLVMEYGVMGSTMYLAKKLFCWAAYKGDKTLQIFTHEFPPVQKW